MSRLTRTNEAIRRAAESVARQNGSSYDEEIVAAVEQELGWDLSESGQRLAIGAYTRKRNEILGDEDRALARREA